MRARRPPLPLPAGALERALAAELADVEATALAAAVRHLLRRHDARVDARVLLFVGDALARERPGDDWLPAAVAVEFARGYAVAHHELAHGVTGQGARPTVQAACGRTAAILAGDYLYTRSVESLSGVCDALAGDAEPVQTLVRSCRRTTEGEARAVELADDADPTRTAYVDVIARHAGAPLAGAAEIGARLAGADDAIARRAAAYGRHLGVARWLAGELAALEGTAVPETAAAVPTADGVPALAAIHARERGATASPSPPLDLDREALSATGSLAHVRDLVGEYARAAAGRLRATPGLDASGALAELAARTVRVASGDEIDDDAEERMTQ